MGYPFSALNRKLGIAAIYNVFNYFLNALFSWSAAYACASLA